ncbi:SLATT domain-containing protein [Lactobacillus gallinarum]|uniref:SLATT domain-containing protein n=1 Tax=Lactobacillus gallinarum TaxID=52242 RepID=UPI0024BB639E|nr:SLATT domain-containing protein [Lactobacillus gallinarum]
MDRENLFNDVKDLLLSVKWTHKITAAHYDRLSNYNRWIVWIKVFAALLSSGSVASLLIWFNLWYVKLLSIIGSVSFTLIELVSNKFNLEKNRAILFNAKEELWEISLELTSLDREIKSKSDNISLQDEKKKYLELLNKVKGIQLKLSSPIQKDIAKASKEIKDRHDDDNRENEKVLLPPDLWNFKGKD